MEILVSSAVSPALRCAFCHDDLMEEDRYRCPACTGVSHRDCASDYGRCPVWGCSARLHQEPQAFVPAPDVVPMPQPPAPVEQTSRRTSILPRFGAGLIAALILWIAHPPIGLIMLAIAAFLIMSLTDPSSHEEEEAS